MVTGKNNNIDVNDVDIKNYTKFLLKEGNIEEKRELLSCLMSKLVLENKKVSLSD